MYYSLCIILSNNERGLKVYVTLKITFKKLKIQDGEEYFMFKDAYFNSKTFTLLNIEEIKDALDRASKEISNKVAVWVQGRFRLGD